MELRIGLILVSNKILLKKEPAAWMYREQPEAVGDSGWRIFSGTEEDDYLVNPSNFKFIAVDSLLLIEEDLKANLLAPLGASFEKNRWTKDWEIANKAY